MSKTLGRTDVTGDQLRWYRENVLDMSREQLAVGIGMSLTTITLAEQRGRGYIQPSLAIRITNGENRVVEVNVRCALDPDQIGDQS